MRLACAPRLAAARRTQAPAPEGSRAGVRRAIASSSTKIGVTTRQPPRLGSDDIRPFRRPQPCHAMWTCHLRCSDGAYVLAAHDIGHRITEPACQPICRALLGQQARGTKHCVPVFRGAQQVQNLPVGTRLPARFERNGPQEATRPAPMHPPTAVRSFRMVGKPVAPPRCVSPRNHEAASILTQGAPQAIE